MYDMSVNGLSVGFMTLFILCLAGCYTVSATEQVARLGLCIIMPIISMRFHEGL